MDVRYPVLFSSYKNEIGVLFLLHLISDRNPHIFNCRKIGRGGKNLVASCPWVAFATPCHPLTTGLVGRTLKLRGMGGGLLNEKCHVSGLHSLIYCEMSVQRKFYC